jgi:hypothetical protein
LNIARGWYTFVIVSSSSEKKPVAGSTELVGWSLSSISWLAFLGLGKLEVALLLLLLEVEVKLVVDVDDELPGLLVVVVELWLASVELVDF